MDLEQMVSIVKSLYGEEIDNDIVVVYLQVAIRKALDRLYPFGNGEEDLPNKYTLDVCELAVRLLARRQGEGEIQHSENGVARIYQSVDDNDILQRFIPMGKVL